MDARIDDLQFYWLVIIVENSRETLNLYTTLHPDMSYNKKIKFTVKRKIEIRIMRKKIINKKKLLLTTSNGHSHRHKER